MGAGWLKPSSSSCPAGPETDNQEEEDDEELSLVLVRVRGSDMVICLLCCTANSL